MKIYQTRCCVALHLMLAWACMDFISGSHLNITEFRLADGPTQYEGRLEVKVDNIWGTVCRNNFGFTDAKVVCKLLLGRDTYTRFYADTRYGIGSGPIFIDRLGCAGTESDLNECSHSIPTACTHSHDVAVHCAESLYNETAVRLVGGNTQYDGRVEINIDGEWGTIRRDYFDSTAAITICQMMGITTSNGVVFTTARYGPGTGAIYLYYLNCRDNERNILNCVYNYNDNYMSYHGYDIGVLCSECGLEGITDNHGSRFTLYENGSMLNAACRNGDEQHSINYTCLNGSWVPVDDDNCTRLDIQNVRLADGVDSYNGRVELFVNNTWLAVCRSSSDEGFGSYTFGSNEASSVCNVFGYSYYRYRTDYSYQAGSIFVDNLKCQSPYADPNSCTYTLVNQCIYGRMAFVICSGTPTIDAVQLVRGPNIYEGIAEVNIDGQWGRFCYLSFDQREADVLCRTVGKMFGSFELTKRLANDTTVPWTRYITCDGTETYVNGCVISNSVHSYCFTPTYELMLKCTDCGSLPNHYGTAFIPSENDTMYSAMCSDGHEEFNTAYTCLNGSVTDLNNACGPLDIKDIRLAGSIDRLNGRVEVLVNDTWGVVCGRTYGTIIGTYEFGTYESRTVCSMIHGSDSQEESVYSTNIYSSKYGRGEGQVFIDMLKCDSGDIHINNCTYSTVPKCSASYIANVQCNGVPEVNAVRLVNGWSQFDGIPEINYDGVWGRLCSDYFGLNEASVFCRMLNKSLTFFTADTEYRENINQNEYRYISCTGNENHLRDCYIKHDLYVYRSYNCKVRNAMQTICTDCGELTVEMGTITNVSSDNSNVSVSCNYGSVADELNIQCSNGSWLSDGYCEIYGYPLDIDGVRLNDGSSENDGRVEVLVNNTWGTICGNGFDTNSLNVLCRMINESYSGTAFYFTNNVDDEDIPIHMDRLDCQGSEQHINNCTYYVKNRCDHSQDVTLMCNECGPPPDVSYWGTGFYRYAGATVLADCDYFNNYVGTRTITCGSDGSWITDGVCLEYNFPLNISNARLSNGNDYDSGRIELEVFGYWGTICKDNIGLKEASVLCRMLGFASATAKYLNASYPLESGAVFVDNLNCNGDENHINDCYYDTVDDCDHTDDIYIVCLECPVLKLDGGSENDTSTAIGTVIEITCDEGYRLEGPSVITCQSNGSWSNNSHCNYIDCGDPSPENGQSNSTYTSYGTVVTITCDRGYGMAGNPVMVCQYNSSWSVAPVCNIVDCGALKVTNGEVDLPNITTYGEIAVVGCLDGYLPGGKWPVNCLANGSWSETPHCEIRDCGDPTPYRGLTNSTMTSYGTVISVSCENGIELNGSSVITCQADGTWSDNPVCDNSDCGQPSVANGKMSILTNGTTIGNVASVDCDAGYDLDGPQNITCTSEGWTGNFTCQMQDCGNVSIANGRISSITGTLFGDEASVECNTGYERVGSSIITCVDGGVWSDNPECQIMDCGTPSIPENGHVVLQDGVTTYTSRLNYSCDPGYLLIGVSVSTCSSNGDWASPLPICEAQSSIGEPCTEVKYCSTKGAQCVNQTCMCVTRIHDHRTNKCDTMPLFQYGDEVNDVALVDECSEAIYFRPAVPIFNTPHEKLFVCSNGIVSFGDKYQGKNPKRTWNKFKDRTLIAPFYANIRRKKSGKVSYRSYDILNDYPFTDNAKVELEFIERIVRQNGGIANFEAKFVLISTWDRVRPSQRTFDRSTESTFQLVLASNGVETFALTVYGHGLMQWTTHSTDPNVWVGYYSYGGDKKIMYSNMLSFSQPILRMDTESETGGVSGLLFKGMFNVTAARISNPAVECIDWYNTNMYRRSEHYTIASSLPECPCDLSLARFDPWFWRIRSQIRWWWWSDYKPTEIMCVEMSPAWMFKPYGKSCCYYRSTYKLVEDIPDTGGFQFYHSHYDAVGHSINDISMKEKCCSQSNYCDLFHRLHPIGSCYSESPYDFGSFWGDPHFQTLDGLRFTFNGLGEYTLLTIRSENVSFDLEARTERAVKDDGNFSDATVFSAFAAKDNTNASLHVELNAARNGVTLYGNGADLTSQFRLSNNSFEYISESGNLILSENDGYLSVFFPSSGISLNISVRVEMLSLTTVVPKKHRGQCRGLLGNYDGQPNNDLTTPSGATLPSNSTDREIFEYGQTWTINTTTSAFIYEDGKNHTYYHNASYTPPFLDEVKEAQIAEAERICNGTKNAECIFDYAFTGRKEVADDTKSKRDNADESQIKIRERYPVLGGCPDIHATVGEDVTCQLNYDMNESVAIRFIENSNNARYYEDNHTVYFNLDTANPVNIRLAAENDKGLFSQPIQIEIIVCTGCNGHGTCTGALRETSPTLSYFKYESCHCEPQYEGPDCEREVDGCAGIPCSLGRNCTTLTAEEQVKQNASYLCSECPSGFVVDVDDELDCIDIDECEDLSDNCQQNCINTEGSYSCMCNDGYRIDAANSNGCSDTNECDEASHNCTQVCTNTDGGFTCGCRLGFVFNDTTWTCVSDITYDPCTTTDLDCSQTAGCTLDEHNQTTCFCLQGSELITSGLNLSCSDIDECERSVCPQECLNTIGSFQCRCYNGFELRDTASCTECEIPFWGPNCENRCACTGQGADICDSVRGCICNSGWEGEHCDIDVNECDVIDVACPDPKQICRNAIGSYLCECIDGYELQDDGECGDINECSNPSLYNCQQTCTNTIGGYTCGCLFGYTQSNQTHCSDIDECSLGTDGCEQICDNLPGLYNCYCHGGYKLSDDRHSCTQTSDLCQSMNNLSCSGYCIIQDNAAECKCSNGYAPDVDNGTCQDINECEDDNLNLCDNNDYCVNTDGSFECRCPPGKKLENDKRTCTDCDRFHYGLDCSKTCSCLFGTCNNTVGCICEPGWTGEHCDTDIDECSFNDCKDVNTVCVNTPGSSECRCRTGFRLNDTTEMCEDVDECLDVMSNNCAQLCNNTVGSYECDCRRGFLLEQGTCSDINECMGNVDCAHICDNTVGSYRCSCNAGFRLDLSDRKSCLPEHECTTSQKSECPTHAECLVTNNKPECICAKGYQNETDQCKDINECLSTEVVCSQNCTNIDGGFSCSCQAGFHLLKDDITCRECANNYYGADCQHQCSCNTPNTLSCDNVLGTCECKTGWNGNQCTDDVDECSSDNTCPANTTCKNTLGGYTCQCNDGFYKTKTDSCQECLDGYFGENCQHSCTCNDPNTQSCDKLTGACECLRGWEGQNCTEDIIECDSDDDNNCPNNSTCSNTLGSYSCACDSGFVMNAHNICDDVVECNDPKLHNCTNPASCENKVGSYYCKCPLGMELTEDGFSCTECDDGHFGENCGHVCGCLHGTCNKETGSCSCIEEWTGNNCTVDVNECLINDQYCVEQNTVCNNTEGGADCICKDNYSLNVTSGLCEDIDECINMDPTPCEHICTNVDGGFKCECYKGFIPANNTCTDIDECKIPGTCHQQCENTEGSYYCACYDGFYLNSTDNQTCLALEVCTDEDRLKCPNMSTCFRNTTETGCICDAGYDMIDDVCEDIDECTSNTRCSHNCTNTAGGFLCSCDVGYSLLEDQTTCQECDDKHFGLNCEFDCECSISSSSCNKGTGVCICNQGWTGSICADDINECNSTELYNCTDHSHCVNTQGSYQCICDVGFVISNDGACEVCGRLRFGTDCKQECGCVVSKTNVCDNVNGICSCKEGWIGDTCNIDVDPCSKNNCNHKPNSRCQNMVGGSYECVCNDGFLSENDHCEECSNNTYGLNCSATCTCNLNNSENQNQSCDTITGECRCNAHWTGNSCEQDINECIDKHTCNDIENAGCHNEIGGFKCACKIGFEEDENSKCVKVSKSTTPSVPATGMSIDMTVKISINLENGTDLSVSTTFDVVAAKVIDSLTSFFGKYTTEELTVIINQMRIGSLIVDYTVISNKKSDPISLAVTSAALDLGKGSEIQYDGVTVPVSADQFANADVCDVFMLTDGCEEGYTCEINNLQPSCRPPNSGDSYGLIVGLSVGGGLGIIALVVFVICARSIRQIREKGRKGKRLKHNALNDTNGLKSSDSVGKSDGARHDVAWRSMARNITPNNMDPYLTPYQLPRPKPVGGLYGSEDSFSKYTANYSNNRN